MGTVKAPCIDCRSEVVCDRHRDVHAFYRGLLPALRAAARDHGYALGVHGSERRDLDVIAAPWTEAAVAADVLAEALRACFDGVILTQHDGHRCASPERKPNGRLAWSIYTQDGSAYLDLSVMPIPGRPIPNPEGAWQYAHPLLETTT